MNVANERVVKTIKYKKCQIYVTKKNIWVSTNNCNAPHWAKTIKDAKEMINLIRLYV